LLLNIVVGCDQWFGYWHCKSGVMVYRSFSRNSVGELVDQERMTFMGEFCLL